MRAGTSPLTRGVAVAVLVLVAAGALAGGGLRYWNALPAEVPPPLEPSTIAALAALALGIVLLIELQRSSANLELIDLWAILAVATLAGVLAGLVAGPLPDNGRAFGGTVHLELKSPIKAKFDTSATVHCETIPGTDRVAWLAATSMAAVETPGPETPEPEASGSPDQELPALSVYLALGGGRPVGISIATSPSTELMTGPVASLEIVAGDRSGRATFSGLFTDETWIGAEDGGYLTGSIRWDCSDRLPDEVTP